MASQAELSEIGNQLEERYRQIVADTRSPEFKSLALELHAWLQRCVDRGRFLPPGASERRHLQGQIDYWTSLLRQAGQTFDDIDRIAPFDPEAGHVLPADRFPYYGLQAVTTDGSRYFFGRDEQTQEYADHIDGHPALLIQSESGGGKSSIAMAGVLPELRRRHPDWLVLPRVTPGTAPADALQLAFAELLGTDLADAAAVQAALSGRTVLVYVDQLEELLTMCSDVQQQLEFSEMLATLADAGVLRLVATMRVDHYERLAHSVECNRLFGLLTRDGSVKTLPPMSLAQIRSVILKPAEAVGLRFVPASIVETLASETANAPSGLPLLQFALQRLWDERPLQDGQPLDMVTLKTYASLPTLSTALGSVAERYYEEMLSQGLVDGCRRLMLELTVIDERLEVPLRRRRAEGEVLQVLTAAGLADPAQAQSLVDGLVERRLLVRTGSGAGRQIEVAHEALFRYWKRFQEWFNSEDTKQTLRETRHIAREALLWQQSSRSPDLLNLRGERLERALAHRQQHWLEPDAVTYVDACLEEAKAVQARTERAERAEAEAALALERERRGRAKSRQQRWLAGAAALVLGTVAVATIITLYARATAREATGQATAAIASSLAYVLPQLKPMEGLDLAYTLSIANPSSPEFRASLAHAIAALDSDGGTGPSAGRLVGSRKDHAADFTTSGQAVSQLVGSEDRIDHALIHPLGAGLSGIEPPIRIQTRLEAPYNREVLALLDVGPRIDPKQGGGRLVVLTYMTPPGSPTPALTRARVIRAGDGRRKPEKLVDLLFPNQPPISTQTTSDIAFKPNGEGLAVVARLAGEPNHTQVMRWSLGQAQAELEPSIRGNDAVTALAWVADGSGLLMRGRADGSVDCGKGKPISANPSAAVGTLRAAYDRVSGRVKWATRHRDNNVLVGDCGESHGDPLKLTPATEEEAQRLVLRRLPDAPGAFALHYAARGKVICQNISRDGRSGLNCNGHGVAAESVMPALDADDHLLGYRLLDSAEPLMSFWNDGGRTVVGTSPTPGLPVATTRSEQSEYGVDASSPDGTQRIKLRNDESRNATLVRLATKGGTEAPLGVLDPQAAAVNDSGVVVTLSSRRAAERHEIKAFGADNALLPGADKISDAACMKPSPDGQRVVVASDDGSAALFTVQPRALLAGQVIKGANASGGGPRADPAVACAVGNGATPKVVVASASGKVSYSGVDARWVTLSGLVPFKIGTAPLDVSVDAESRFVAVVSTRIPSGCRNAADGHFIRIWDLRQERPDFPVYSACIQRVIQGLGAMRRSDEGRWVLPVYVQSDSSANEKGTELRRLDIPCPACANSQNDLTAVQRLNDLAEKLQPRILPLDEVREIYGIQLPGSTSLKRNSSTP